MSLLEQQLKELQSKRAQADFLRSLSSTINTTIDPHSDEDKSVHEAKQQIVQEVTDFINSRIHAIENGLEIQAESDEDLLTLTQDEIAVLKEMVVRLQRPPAPAPAPRQSPRRQQVQQNQGAFADEGEFEEEQEEPQPRRRQRPQPPQQPRGGRRDIVAFAMQHRGLDGKRVTFQSPGGQVIGGRVVGMEMPNIVVQTDTGHTIGIPPEELTVG